MWTDHEIFDYKYNDINLYSERIESVSERIAYLKYVLKELRKDLIFLNGEPFKEIAMECISINPYCDDLSSGDQIKESLQLPIDIERQGAYCKVYDKMTSKFLKKKFGELYNVFNDLKYMRHDELIQRESNTIVQLVKLKKILKVDINYLQEHIKSLQGGGKMNITSSSVEKIRWNGSERQLIYLVDLLFKNDLLSISEYYNERFSLIAQHFKNRKGSDIKAKQLSTTASEMKNGKPNKNDAEQIEAIIDKVKEGV